MPNQNVTCNIVPANRVNQISEYYFSKKLKEVAEMNARGLNVISLGIGSPDRPPHAETIETLCRESRKDNTHGYQPYVGIPELRRAFADWYHKWYGVELDPSCEIQPLIGSKEGILHISLAFLNPGDGVLVPNPGYPTYTSVSRLAEARIIPYELCEENGWQPDFDALDKCDLSGVKLMWVNYPHMPTGAPASRELFEKLVDFGRRHNIIIVNDNPYSFILNDKPLSLLSIPGAKEICIEMNSMSKSHNMPGWRVGMLASNAQFVSWILRVKSNIDSGTFRPMAGGRRPCPVAAVLLVRRQQPHLPGTEGHCRTDCRSYGLHVRPQTAGYVPLGQDSRHHEQLYRTGRQGSLRSPCLHHARHHIRQPGGALRAHLSLCRPEGPGRISPSHKRTH